MKYILNPSLQQMCLTKIAVQLWNAEDEIADPDPSENKVFLKMRGKVETLPLPMSLKMQLLSDIKQIHDHIFRWYLYIYREYDVQRINPRNLVWTSSGTMDKVKSAQLMLQRDQSLDLKKRYQLACNFCLVEEVQALLREEMSEEVKLPVRAYSSTVQTNDQDLVVYFTQHVSRRFRRIEGDLPPYLSLYHEACHVAILAGNPTATKYFFQRLNSEEKHLIISILRADWSDEFFSKYGMVIPHECFAELVCFLLSQMNENQQADFFRACPHRVVQSLVVWPYNRPFLLETVSQMWDCLGGGHFGYLLSLVDLNMMEIDDDLNKGHCEYREMYFALWHSSPIEYRKYFIDQLGIENLFYYIHSGRVDLCKLVLSEASAEQKERMFLDERWIDRCYRLFAGEDLWNFFEFYIEECGISGDTITRFIEQLITHILDFDDCELLITEFFQFLNNFDPDSKENKE